MTVTGFVSEVSFDSGTISAPAVFHITLDLTNGPDTVWSGIALNKLAKQMHQSIAVGANIWVTAENGAVIDQWGIAGLVP